jgi:hypothetical protein
MHTSCASPPFYGAGAFFIPPTHPDRRAVSAAPPAPTSFRDAPPRPGAPATAGADLACAVPALSVPRSPVSAAIASLEACRAIPIYGTAGLAGPLAVVIARRQRDEQKRPSRDQLMSWRGLRYSYEKAGGIIEDLSGETATRSPAAVDFKISNNFGALLSGGESAIGLHFVTGHHLVGVSDEAIERGPIPCQIGVLHGT